VNPYLATAAVIALVAWVFSIVGLASTEEGWFEGSSQIQDAILMFCVFFF
jgi:hypothetical protein